MSVYIPTKNRVTLLRRAIESVLAQTYASVEVMVVNDGSTDETVQYLETLRNDSRVRVIHNEQSMGAPRSRNAAILAAQGEFVTGLDDDDYFHPQRIASFVEHWSTLERNAEQFSCLYSQDLIQQGSGGFETSKPARVEHEDLYYYNSIGNQVFTRRDYLMRIGLFDEQMPAWQDLDTFIRLLRMFGPARLVDRPLYMLDLDPRTDRISVGSKQRILAAYHRLAAKSPEQSRAMLQGLYLQVFGPLYGLKIGHADLKEFFRYGVHLRTFKRFVGLLLRQAFSN